MPFIRISLAAQPTPAQVADLQRRTTALMGRILGKREPLTVVTVETQAPVGWSVGGQGVPAGAGLAQMEAFITAGTNSAEEKAAFVHAAHDLLAGVLPAAAGPIYVIVRETPATDWGYGGLTQAARQATAA